jgi:hypothetical protein
MLDEPVRTRHLLLAGSCAAVRESRRRRSIGAGNTCAVPG